jgi:hypothetical protein
MNDFFIHDVYVAVNPALVAGAFAIVLSALVLTVWWRRRR